MSGAYRYGIHFDPAQFTDPNYPQEQDGQYDYNFDSNKDTSMYASIKIAMKKDVLFETVRGAVHGTVVDVNEDHAVLESNGKKFFVRMEQIVYMMPL